MPTVRNRSGQELNLRTGHVLGPHEQAEISDEQATVLAGHPLLEQPPAPRRGRSTDTQKEEGEQQ